MKNKTKLHRPMRQPRRFPNAQPTLPTRGTPTDQRQDFLVLCYYPGMPIRPENPVAA